jgi:hypothetical protein
VCKGVAVCMRAYGSKEGFLLLCFFSWQKCSSTSAGKGGMYASPTAFLDA